MSWVGSRIPKLAAITKYTWQMRKWDIRSTLARIIMWGFTGKDTIEKKKEEHRHHQRGKDVQSNSTSKGSIGKMSWYWQRRATRLLPTPGYGRMCVSVCVLEKVVMSKNVNIKIIINHHSSIIGNTVYGIWVPCFIYYTTTPSHLCVFSHVKNYI